MTPVTGGELHRRFWRGGRLWVGGAITILLSTTMATVILVHARDNFMHTRQDVAGLEGFRPVLDAASLISAERAPSTMLMADETAPARDRLRAARAATDQALAHAAGTVSSAALQETLRQLEQARNLVDRAAERPDRYDGVQGAIDALFAADDAYWTMMIRQSATLIGSDPRLAAPIRHALILCGLRDNAGRLGSVMLAPLIAQTPMPPRNVSASDRLAGRMAVEWQLLELNPSVADHGPRLAALRQHAERAFFDDGQPLVARIIAEGTQGTPYTQTAVAFADRYARTLAPLETWRTNDLDIVLSDFRRKARHAFDMLWIISGATLTVTGLIAGGVLLVHLRVLAPLLEASEAVVDLGHDEPLRLPRRHRGSRELQPLYEALEILDARLRERAAQTQALKHQAETDELTQLLNRRALQILAKPRLEISEADERAFLILLDIDHFKSINDRHGHTEGDRVLVAVAAALREQVRPDDLVARFGGEEFAILIRAHTQMTALSMAHRLRRRLGSLKVVSAQNVRIPVTASFGVAAGDNLTWRQLVAKADVALYAAKRAGRNTVRLAEHDAEPADEGTA
ncbi:GGDEF domain-containing protein [Gluconacetobacter diazotrophicus]|nr:GGDEF domain-containing protein [Gluconacetobacter diazotrophicus]